MIKVLGMALYGPLAASTRYRLGQYVEGLSLLGIDLQICHLLSDDYLRWRYGGEAPSFPAIMGSGCKRITDLIRQNDFDVVLLYCELFPLLPGSIERFLIRKPYIYDYDDAFYLKYTSGRLSFSSPLLGNKIAKIIEGAAEVTAGNQLLVKYAKQHNPKTSYFPTVVDTTRYTPQLKKRGSQVFTVGWIGSPSTAPYLSELVAALTVIGLEGDVRFIVVGGKAPIITSVTIKEMEWNESTELDLINSFDVGVMPLPDNDWTRGKCAFKLIQYMACAVPVIASPVGANSEVVNCFCGFMAGTTQEWIDALRLLRDNPERRNDMGQAGRESVEKNYSLQHSLPVLAQKIMNAIDF